ncbi:universal stress protein [Lactococcus cremoris]|uniref:Universal stress protein n=1 Tax=Lactococcus lactis subsp. cremoris TaxID=1359 RepID=A0AAX4AKY2_LACLC|nr:universal stress protein [Lactococcus cremoris]AGV73869.1 universal stress protein [Lactococcus cremoris subsp. cremoris KW2]KGH34239.1 universal stress protein UspA [Lactococcus cremoris]MDR9867588.1 universal stress protein [Lactococcus cremoris]QSE63830.1 universal stress protein [Lactococcus cremoris]WMX71788.1 universal stress protein [Lactococcus cremoris]
MVEQYKNILVAVDGSEQSYDALREAIETAQANDSQLKILYVLNDKLANIPVHLDTMTLYKSVQEHSDYVVDQVQGYLKDTEVNFEIVRLTGSPKREIINYSKENNIDLIVLGSTGLDAIDRFIIGSTTQYIVNHASCNVMVVK